MARNTVVITFSIPSELLEEVEDGRGARDQERSEFICNALRTALSKHPESFGPLVDEKYRYTKKTKTVDELAKAQLAARRKKKSTKR